MEIIRFLISFFLKEYGGENFDALFNTLKDSNFNLKTLLNGLNAEKLAPIFKIFTEGANGAKKSPTKEAEQFNGLSPISNIADKEIVNSLNKYFAV